MTSSPASSASFVAVRGARLGVVQHRRAAGRRGVGDDEAAEAPLALAASSVSSMPILRRRRSVHRVVRAHHRARAAPAIAASNGGKNRSSSSALADVDRIAVAPTLADVGDEVLRRRDDARALERRDERAAHHRRQIRILAVRLLHAAPAHVAGDVDHRRQHLPNASAPRLARDRAARRAPSARCPRSPPARSPAGNIVAPSRTKPCSASSNGMIGMPSRVRSTK